MVLSAKRERTHYPNLSTVIMVEEVLAKMDESAIKVSDLKRKLPKQVNHNTLKIILEYLENSYKIVFGLKGITWIHNRNQNLRNALEDGHKL